MSEVVTWNDLGEEPPVMMQAPLVSLLLVDGGLEGKTHFWIFFWMGETHTQFYIIQRLMISKA
jgi:hypothetical protein